MGAKVVSQKVMALESCKKRVTRSTFYDEMEKITDLVVEGSVVAVESGDTGEDYYLLRANAAAYGQL